MNRIIFILSHMRWEKTAIISCHCFPLACHILLWHKHADFHEVSNPGWIFWMDAEKTYDAVIATSNLLWYSPTEKKKTGTVNSTPSLASVRCGKMGKKNVTYFATLLHNELNSNVACFTTHAKKPCNLICCKTRLLWGLKRATSLYRYIAATLQKMYLFHVFCCPFYCGLRTLSGVLCKSFPCNGNLQTHNHVKTKNSPVPWSWGQSPCPDSSRRLFLVSFSFQGWFQ